MESISRRVRASKGRANRTKGLISIDDDAANGLINVNAIDWKFVQPQCESLR